MRCNKCGSTRIKKSGPYAQLKEEGEPAHKGPVPVYYHCWDCGSDWEEKE